MVTNKLGIVLKMQRAGQVEAVSNLKPGLIWGKCMCLETEHIFFIWNYAMMGPSYSMKTFYGTLALLQRPLEVNGPVSHTQVRFFIHRPWQIPLE